MNHFTFSASLTCVAAGIVCLVSWMGKPSRLRRIFGLHWFSISFWSFFVGWQAYLIPTLSGFWWGWFLHLGCIFIPTFFLHFALEYAGASSQSRKILYVAYSVSVAYLLLNTFTGMFTSSTSYRDAYAYPTPALVYPLYFVTFVSSVIYGTIVMINSGAWLNRAQKKTLWIYLAGHVLGYSGGLDNFLIMADVRIFPLYPFGLYLVTVYAVTSLYALSRENLLERPIQKIDISPPAIPELSSVP